MTNGIHGHISRASTAVVPVYLENLKLLRKALCEKTSRSQIRLNHSLWAEQTLPSSAPT